MVLMRGGSSKGAEFVASRWADAHNVTEMIFLRVGLVTAKRRRSSATMSFCRRFRSASSRSPAAALPRTSPTRREDSEFRFGGVVAMRNLSRLLGLLIPVLRQLCDGKCPIIEPRISPVRKKASWEPNASPRLNVRTSECDLSNPLPVSGR